MFVYSFKASTVRILGVVCVALVGLIALVAFVPTYVTAGQADTSVGQVSSQTVSVRYDKIKTEQDVANFLAQFGWQVEGKAVEVKTVTVPMEFDKIYAGYNQVQLAQGLDLTRYKGKEVTRYTFKSKDEIKPFSVSTVTSILLALIFIFFLLWGLLVLSTL